MISRAVTISNGDQVYLLAYGTGFRAAGTGGVSATIGGINALVLYAGAQGTGTGVGPVQYPDSPGTRQRRPAGSADPPVGEWTAGESSESDGQVTSGLDRGPPACVQNLPHLHLGLRESRLAGKIVQLGRGGSRFVI